MASNPHAILIAGPTASGKSRLAAELALEHRGVVINAELDAGLPRAPHPLARPSPEDEAVPHLLYGHVPAATRYSVGQWLVDAAARHRRGAGDGQHAGLRRRHRPLFQGADRRPRLDPADPGRCPRPRPRRAEDAGRGASCPPRRPRSGDRRRGQAERPCPHPPRHRGRGGDGPAPRPLAARRCDAAAGRGCTRHKDRAGPAAPVAAPADRRPRRSHGPCRRHRGGTRPSAASTFPPTCRR